MTGETIFALMMVILLFKCSDDFYAFKEVAKICAGVLVCGTLVNVILFFLYIRNEPFFKKFRSSISGFVFALMFTIPYVFLGKAADSGLVIIWGIEGAVLFINIMVVLFMHFRDKKTKDSRE